jgi:FkbM family methyltransferase
MKAIFVEGLRRIRPAPLASALAQIAGLNRREPVHTELGTFFVAPMSQLGFHLRHGEYEAATTAVLRKYLTPGAVFIDLGANEGYFTVLASRLVGPQGIVIAVEPQSRLQSVIKTNLEANNCRNVRLVKAVVSSKTQTVNLALTSAINNGASSLFKSTKYPLPTEEVQSFTLGDLFASIEVKRCDLMKMDIEGAEYDALTGAREVLKQGIIRHMTIEVHDSILERRGLSWSRTHEVILECGYRSTDEGGSKVYSFAG